MNETVSLAAAIENLLFVAGQPLSISKISNMLADFPGFTLDCLEAEINGLMEKYAQSAIELKLLPSGYMMQTRPEYAKWIDKLWVEKPRKYSQAFLEVLAIIAYEQPVTRADIEQKRGIAIAPHMLKTLLEREWIKIVGYKDSPGKPALYATTTVFLDYFNLSSLDDLPISKSE